MENLTPEQQAAFMCFEKGYLSFKLKPEQLDIYNKIIACPSDTFVINCSRRLGKSFMLCLICEEFCRQKADAKVKYAAPSKKQVREIIKPLFSQIHRDCPRELQPWWNTLDGCYVFPNGSKISIVGCDKGNIDSLRGEEMHFGVIDEAGMIDENLNYIINDILRPQTLTVKRDHKLSKKIILASTPPVSPAHAFVKYISDAESDKVDRYIHKTIFDNTMVDEKTVLEYAEYAGCIVDWEKAKIVKMSTTFRREYMAEVVTEETKSIVPEFTAELSREIVTENYTRPRFFDAYVSMDMGMIDFTVILFAYWDFEKARLVVEDEYSVNYKEGFNTATLAQTIKEKEKILWGKKKPYLRVMDRNPIMAQDLYDIHDLHFVETARDDKESAINNLRLMVHSKQIIINPKCKTLVAHLKYGVWDKYGRKFDRSGEFGHFDAVDALVYMVRNLNKARNPYPRNVPSTANHFVNPKLSSKISEQEEKLKKSLIRSFKIKRGF